MMGSEKIDTQDRFANLLAVATIATSTRGRLSHQNKRRIPFHEEHGIAFFTISAYTRLATEAPHKPCNAEVSQLGTRRLSARDGIICEVYVCVCVYVDVLLTLLMRAKSTASVCVCTSQA